MFAPKRPDKQVALRELRQHLVALGAWCLLIRGSTYGLHMYHQNK